MSRFVRRRNATDATCHERVYHWQAECWDVPFAHLRDVMRIQQALGCQNMHTASGNWTRPSPPVACLFSRQVSHRAHLGSSVSSGTATCRESRQCPWTPHCPSPVHAEWDNIPTGCNLGSEKFWLLGRNSLRWAGTLLTSVWCLLAIICDKICCLADINACIPSILIVYHTVSIYGSMD